MGCDIHAYAERKTPSGWEMVTKPLACILAGLLIATSWACAYVLGVSDSCGFPL